jgi:hypothetical protein
MAFYSSDSRENTSETAGLGATIKSVSRTSSAISLIAPGYQFDRGSAGLEGRIS